MGIKKPMTPKVKWMQDQFKDIRKNRREKQAEFDSKINAPKSPQELRELRKQFNDRHRYQMDKK